MTLAEPGWGQAADEALAEAMERNPDRLLTLAEDVIAGYGGPEGLTAVGIADYIALERAAARAGAMRKLLALDLDNDGSVARAELAVAVRAESADGRGKLERQFKAADFDVSDTLDPAEIRAEGQLAALKALSDAEADVLVALMGLDANADGTLRVEEVQAAVLRFKEG
ncbi:MAG: hypothetical protein B7Z10_00495 [Rhodobacterales bacterium 32-66-7]|nr:MAG: hypothetical protein B7Z10_00495 [Rhodobacterales bacterium 32-66-7]